jgi:hypothetical protein
MAATCLARHPEWKKVVPLEPPVFVFPKNDTNASFATLRVKIKDTNNATTARKLLETSVSFVGAVCWCLPWTVSPTVRQCSTCMKWGHTAYVCRARVPTCNQCGGPHLSAFHGQHARSCKDSTCSHFVIRCSNCDDQHHASSMACPFFKARSRPGQLAELQKTRVQRLRRRS